MEFNTKYYQEIFEDFKQQYPGWAADTVRYQPKHTHAIRVFLNNGDQVDYNMRTQTSRYRRATQSLLSSPNDITDDDCREAFATNLAEFMRIKGFGQNDLSAATGLSTAIISKYLKKKSTPTVTSLRKIAYALDCHPDELME